MLFIEMLYQQNGHTIKNTLFERPDIYICFRNLLKINFVDLVTDESNDAKISLSVSHGCKIHTSNLNY